MILRKLLLSFLLIGGFSLSAQQLDMDLLHGLKPRSIGPAGMSGRVTALEVEIDNPDNIYLGSAAGGLWKSENGGITWEVLFDDGKSASIGSIAIDQRNPNVIWVGTGEGNPRNSMNNGAGVYKSIDGGQSWEFLGLENTNGIHRIILHPQNPQIAVVAATGTPWGENPERGIYRTTDGGKTWTHTLYIDEKTGAADLVVDPTNPNKMIAAMWEHRRWPWFFNSGGPGSGIFISFDGGQTWTRRTSDDGLPKGDLGRIGLAIAPSDPDRIYAYVESKSNAIYRSDDGGFKWYRVSSSGDRNIGGRPFYYADIYVDPKNENRIYSIHSTVTSSEDGGKTWQTFVPGNIVHTDHHAWWIHPDDPGFILNGHDGGLTITRDRGKKWQFVENLPLGQFYHVRVDDAIPYNIYGGLQDNGSWRGPSQVWFSGGIRNLYWQRLSVGDGFDMVPDPIDDRYGWSMGQGGNLNRYDRISGQLLKVRPVHPEGVPLRFNWNAGIAIDPHDKNVAYYGSQFLHRTRDGGKSWELISPDLTTNDPEKQNQIETGGLTYDNTAAENHTTIISIAPSPVKAGVIWVGTDDGNVQVTEDNGANWNNVIKRIKGVPENSWVAQIQPSSRNVEEAFVVFDNHRNADWTPHVYHTKNMGRSWTRIVDETDVRGATLSFVQDEIEPKLMFVGTEFGLYVSIDAGENWTQWTNGYGSIPAQDMVIHPREYDLVIGTFGRSFYVLDDIRPLRSIAAQGMGQNVMVYPTPDAYLAVRGESFGYRFGKVGDALFEGENRPYGALISYYLNEGNEEAKELSDQVKIEFIMAGEVMRTLYRMPKKGVNRFNWRLERNGVRNPSVAKPKKERAPFGGLPVLPGQYTVRVTYQGNSSETGLNVLPDPRLNLSAGEMKQKDDVIRRFDKNQQALTEMTDQLRAIREGMKRVNENLDGNSNEKEIKDKGKEVKKQVDALWDQVFTKPRQGIYSDPSKLLNKLFGVRYILESTLVPFTPNQRTALEQLEKALADYNNEVESLMAGAWKEYYELVQKSDVKISLDSGS